MYDLPALSGFETRQFQSVLREFRESAIPDRLTEANVQWIEGGDAIQLLTETAIANEQKVTSYVTTAGQRILERYQFAGAGGWVAFGCHVDGSLADAPYFKPKTPRLDFEKRKHIKYEGAKDVEATPLLPLVDDQTAQEIYARYDVAPLENELFWSVVWRCGLPIAVTEGLKKALSLIVHGTPAIALRGITQWHRKGTNELHSVVAHFATRGRQIYIIFDQDTKPKTIQNVRIQSLKLAGILDGLGCQVRIPTWDKAIGKGIDDAIRGVGDGAQAWLDALLLMAPSLKDCRRTTRVTSALDTIARLNQLTHPIERETEGEYLPDLPPLAKGAIHVISASMNSGKTVRIGADWAQWAIAQGWNVLVMTPLNSLGQQAARDWGLPHIHVFGNSKDEQHALWTMVSAQHGLILCPDSLHRIPEAFWQRPCLLILDEANQVVDHLTQGNTLGSRYADIVERFSLAAAHAIQTGAVVLSEDGIPDHCVNFVRSICRPSNLPSSDSPSCDAPIRIFKHKKQGNPWETVVYSGQASGFRAKCLLAVKQGERVVIVTSSQQEAKRLERAIRRLYPDRKVVRIDSETNQQRQFTSFFEAPDLWLQEHQPDVLILSPSAKSGVSIEGGVAPENAYFDSVWAYFPALPTDTHWQLLGRYRPPVPRHIFVPPFVQSNANESLMNPRAIKRRIRGNAKQITGVYGIAEMMEAQGDRAETMGRIESAVLDYLAVAQAVAGAQKQIAHDALVQRLEAAGHQVSLQKLGKDSAMTALWKSIKEEIWRETAEAISSAKIDDSHTIEWARKTLDSADTSLETRTKAHKVLWRAEFPGILFDDPEEVYAALCEDYGSMRRGVLMQAKAENLDAAKEMDRKAVESILKGGIKPLHRLPKGYIQALLIAKTGALELLTGTYSNGDPRAISVKREALKWAREIYYWLGLTINEQQTPVEISNKLLKKMGIKGQQTGERPGQREVIRDWIYVVESANPVRTRLLEAIRSKLSGVVSSISTKDNQSIEIEDTRPESPPNGKFAPPPTSLNDEMTYLYTPTAEELADWERPPLKIA
jgi:hypothetical protein